MLDLLERAHDGFSLFDGLCLLVLLVWAAFAFFVPAPLARKTARLLSAPARSIPAALRKRHPILPYLAIFLISLAASFTLFARIGEPVPAFHDEYSYLLAGDTFAHGRLTNPTPAAWESFETFHVLMQPTYMSKYPPGQGLSLAFGQAVTGFPIVGVWLMVAFACAASLWLLRSVLPGRWAFWGTFALLFHPQITAWSTCYWGGGIPLAGGALVLGGAARLARTGSPRSRPRRDGGLLGVGAGLLVLSRPFEGMVLLCLTLAGLWFVTSRRSKQVNMAAVRHGAAAGLVPIGLTAAFVMVYNHAVTGSAWTLPYSVYTKTYESYPPFRWWPALPLHTYHSPTMDVFYRHWSRKFDAASADPLGTFPHFVGLALQAVFSLEWRGGLLGMVLLAGTAAAFVGFKRLNIVLRGALLVTMAFFVILTGHFWILAHYAAPVVPATLALSVTGLRFLGAKRLHKTVRPTGTLLSCFMLPVLCLLTFVGYVNGQAAPGTAEFASFYRWHYARAALQTKIAEQGGKHIIFVQYAPRHIPDQEWVFNGANFAQSPVLWAHSLGPEQDAVVQQAYPDRQAWRVVVASDWATPQIVPYAADTNQPK